ESQGLAATGAANLERARQCLLELLLGEFPPGEVGEQPGRRDGEGGPAARCRAVSGLPGVFGAEEEAVATNTADEQLGHGRISSGSGKRKWSGPIGSITGLARLSIPRCALG